MRARDYVACLLDNVNGFYKDELTYEQFSQWQQRIWKEISAAGLDHQVLKLLRARPNVSLKQAKA